jgi:ssDNA thymidine ADP-ribosyltransferase, DarT
LLRSEVGELFYITHVANVGSILATGILSHNLATSRTHISVALNVIQEIRSRIAVSPTRMLHDHANLYLCGRGPMMSYVVHHNRIADVCVLRVTSEMLDLQDVVVSDGNASSKWTRFDTPAVGLPGIDVNRLHAEWWTHPGEPVVEKWEHARQKAAEVLVPEFVDRRRIIGAYAPTDGVAEALRAVMGPLDVTVARYPFFDGSGWT